MILQHLLCGLIIIAGCRQHSSGWKRECRLRRTALEGWRGSGGWPFEDRQRSPGEHSENHRRWVSGLGSRRVETCWPFAMNVLPSTSGICISITKGFIPWSCVFKPITYAVDKVAVTRTQGSSLDKRFIGYKLFIKKIYCCYSNYFMMKQQNLKMLVSTTTQKQRNRYLRDTAEKLNFKQQRFSKNLRELLLPSDLIGTRSSVNSTAGERHLISPWIRGQSTASRSSQHPIHT